MAVNKWALSLLKAIQSYMEANPLQRMTSQTAIQVLKIYGGGRDEAAVEAIPSNFCFECLILEPQ